MKELVGVVDPFLFGSKETITTVPLKQHALLFSRLAIPQLEDVFLKQEPKEEQTKEALAELQWLYESGIIFNPKMHNPTEVSSSEHEEAVEGTIQHALGLIGLLFGLNLKEIYNAKNNHEEVEIKDEEFQELYENLEKLPKLAKAKLRRIIDSPEFFIEVQLMTMHQTRMFSIGLREAEGLDAHAILSTTIPTAKEDSTKSDILRIILNALPIPDETTPWEQIIEYRSDPDSMNKFLALRHWTSEVARAELSPPEIEEKLGYLLNQYQQHMNLHRMKTNTTTFETVVTTTAEVLGDFASLRWGDAAKALFALKNRQIALLEGELTAPGNEVAYIFKARETFNN